MYSNSLTPPRRMPERSYPLPYMVDTHATRPSVPPRVERAGEGLKPAQCLLFLLVSLALCGMLVEACFIYRLYRMETVTEETVSSMLVASALSAPSSAPMKAAVSDLLPSKPVAHLTDGQDAVHSVDVMSWSRNSNPILYQMSYTNGQLIILEEGYYYVYSKLFFQDSGIFHHYVNLRTERYTGDSMTILQSRKFSPESTRTRSNSYLGGVFHLYKNDELHVKVSNTSKIIRSGPFENFFGAYMI